MRPCPENKWSFSPALLNPWEGLSYKANIGHGTNKQDSDQSVHFRCQNLVFTSISMNSENVDTELSLQMLKLPCALFLRGGGGGGGAQYTLRKEKHCRP